MVKTSTENIIVRYPPSPTGLLHVGNMRTLIFNYLFMKKHEGKALLRIEDTDRERSKQEYVKYIKESLGWLGMTYEASHQQSERLDIYRGYLEKLIEEGKAYISEEEPTLQQIERAQEKGKELNTSVIRLKNANKDITFTDVVLGDVTINTSDLGDFIIAKNLDHPLYHFTVVIDDWLMGITHIIRGSDHMPNTPRQILIQEAVGAPRPEAYVHLPLIVGLDGKKLGKRHGATGTLEYRDMGYLPEAFLNFMAFIGWNPGTTQEVFTRDDLVKSFDLSGIQKGSAVFNLEKLDWFNKEHLSLMSDEEKKAYITPFIEALPYGDELIVRYEQLASVLFERISKGSDINEMHQNDDLAFYAQDPLYDSKKIAWKKSTNEQALLHLKKVYEMLMTYDGAWESEKIKSHLWNYAEEHGKGDVLWPLRYALSGKDKSPDPMSLLSIFEKDESLRRIALAIALLEEVQN